MCKNVVRTKSRRIPLNVINLKEKSFLTNLVHLIRSSYLHIAYFNPKVSFWFAECNNHTYIHCIYIYIYYWTSNSDFENLSAITEKDAYHDNKYQPSVINVSNPNIGISKSLVLSSVSKIYLWRLAVTSNGHRRRG